MVLEQNIHDYFVYIQLHFMGISVNLVRPTGNTLNGFNLSVGWCIDFHESSHINVYSLYTLLHIAPS